MTAQRSESAANVSRSAADKTIQKDNADDVMEVIRSLHQMKEDGIITEEEFSAKKAAMLEKI